MDRRQSLGLMGGVVAALAWSSEGRATTARAISLPDLVRRSTRIVRSTPLDSFARAEDVGGIRHIVTYSRLRIDDLIQGGPSDSEVLVRTLGGQLADIGEIVHGEAVLALNEECVVFLHQDAEGIDHVTEMAQGHYPMSRDPSGVSRLFSSRNMPHLLPVAGVSPAVAQLAGLQFKEARQLILGTAR